MFRIENLSVVAQISAEVAVRIQLVLDPERTRHRKGAQSTRRRCRIRFENAFELEQRLVIEADEVEVGDFDPGLLQAILDGVGRKPCVAFLASESLFLYG